MKYNLGSQIKSVYHLPFNLQDYIYLKAWDVSLSASIKMLLAHTDLQSEPTFVTESLVSKNLAI